MNKDIEIRATKRKGKGVFAIRNFHKGKIVFTNIRGRLVKRKDLENILKSEGDHLNEIDKETWEAMNPPGRFVNHSCDPYVISKESVRKRVPYIALRTIKRGEEITTDYRVNAHTGNKWRCHCGSKNCKGFVMSDFFSLGTARQKKYLPYAPLFIRKEYKRRHQNPGKKLA